MHESVQAYSEDDEETVNLQCPGCQKQKFRIEGGKLLCDGCGSELRKGACVPRTGIACMWDPWTNWCNFSQQMPCSIAFPISLPP